MFLWIKLGICAIDTTIVSQEQNLNRTGFNVFIVLNIHNNNIREGVDESTGAGGMFGSRPVYPISVNHACMLTNMVVCPVSFVHIWEREAQLILKIIVEV